MFNKDLEAFLLDNQQVILDLDDPLEGKRLRLCNLPASKYTYFQPYADSLTAPLQAVVATVLWTSSEICGSCMCCMFSCFHVDAVCHGLTISLPGIEFMEKVVITFTHAPSLSRHH
eukprot:jgi/Chrzof1/6817/UNPLg00885.t1